MISFKNKKILVTGASSGIGRQIAIDLSNLDASVTLIGRNENKLKKTLSLMKGMNHKYFVFDLKNIINIKNLLTNTLEYDNIKFDGYVHSAGIPSIYPLRVINYNNFKDTIKTNTYSYIEIIKYFSKRNISNDNASIVYISSSMTEYPIVGQSTYISSKSAGESLAKSLSKELIKRKIRINNVLPDLVSTEMVEDTSKYRDLASIKKDLEIDFVLDPKEVSNVVLFLLSDSSKYIIGENYIIKKAYK